VALTFQPCKPQIRHAFKRFQRDKLIKLSLRTSWVVGSKGELYKCWNSVGNRLEVIGDIREYENPNGRLHKWLKYTPFANAECRDCIALPVCMGGCAHHAMNPIQYENRCGTFRHMHHERVLEFVRTAKAQGSTGLVASASFASRVETR